MIVSSNKKESISIEDLHRRHVIEIITVFIALIVTFYAGYSLGHDHGADDKIKTNIQYAPTITSQVPNIIYSTSTLKKLIDNAPAVATPN